MTKDNLENIYYWLCDNRIPEWELLRFYPVGRTTEFVGITPSNEEYLKTMSFLKSLRGFTRVFFQHSLKILEGNSRCSAGIDSIGILSNGEMIACTWALDRNCFPFKGFYLGKLPEENLDAILKKVKLDSEFSKTANFCRTIAFKEKNL
jgi:MoaA/NifB/PqqE/SkfB family radical SAM enzyme